MYWNHIIYCDSPVFLLEKQHGWQKYLHHPGRNQHRCWSHQEEFQMEHSYPSGKSSTTCTFTAADMRQWNVLGFYFEFFVLSCNANLYSFPVSHSSFFNFLILSVQDEEQDPLLNSFRQLKEILNSIKGTWILWTWLGRGFDWSAVDQTVKSENSFIISCSLYFCLRLVPVLTHLHLECFFIFVSEWWSDVYSGVLSKFPLRKAEKCLGLLVFPVLSCNNGHFMQIYPQHSRVYWND